MSEQQRLDLTALGVGFIAEGAIFTIIYFAGSNGRAVALLFYLEAIVLGYLFGARAGTLRGRGAVRRDRAGGHRAVR